jgi:hypothetical protein
MIEAIDSEHEEQEEMAANWKGQLKEIEKDFHRGD